MSVIKTAFRVIDHQTYTWADGSLDHKTSADNNFAKAGQNLKDAFTFNTHREWTQGTGFFGRIGNVIKGGPALVVDAFELPLKSAFAVKHAVDGVVHSAAHLGSKIF